MTFEGPFGPRGIFYCDYIASGRPLTFIEDFIKEYVSDLNARLSRILTIFFSLTLATSRCSRFW